MNVPVMMWDPPPHPPSRALGFPLNFWIVGKRNALRLAIPDMERAQVIAGIIVGLRILAGEIQVQLKPSKMK